MIAIAITDPWAAILNDVTDLEAKLPGNTIILTSFLTPFSTALSFFIFLSFLYFLSTISNLIKLPLLISYCLILCYLILCYLMLCYLVLSYLILSYLVLSYVILSYLVISDLILYYHILSYLVISDLILSCHILCYLVISYLILSYTCYDLLRYCGCDKRMVQNIQDTRWQAREQIRVERKMHGRSICHESYRRNPSCMVRTVRVNTH